MPFRIFRIRSLLGANVVGFLLGAVIFANFFVLTLYVQQVLGWSALKTGVTFLATAGTTVIWAGVAQALTTRYGPRAGDRDRDARAGRRARLVHPDSRWTATTGPTSCRLTSSSRSGSRSRSCRSRSQLPAGRAARGRARFGADQHHPADRRRDRRRARLDDLHLAARTRCWRAADTPAAGVHLRLPARVLGAFASRTGWRGRSRSCSCAGPRLPSERARRPTRRPRPGQPITLGSDGARVPDAARAGRRDAPRAAPERRSGGRRGGSREARVPQPGRLDQGPDRDHDARGCRARRKAEAGRHDRRAHLRQHRHRPRDRGRAARATAASSRCPTR